MQTVQTISVPWMISPSNSNFSVVVEENGDCVVHANVITAPDRGSGETTGLGHRVSLTFSSGQWVRTCPPFSGDSVVDRTEYNWDKLEIRYDSFSNLQKYLNEFRLVWQTSLLCPDPRLYRIDNSAWSNRLDAGRFGCEHYMIIGSEMSVHILAKGFAWQWFKSPEPV